MRREAITLVFAMGVGSVLMAVRDELAQQDPAPTATASAAQLLTSAPALAGRTDFVQKK
jgi:hypothetical protein